MRFRALIGATVAGAAVAAAPAAAQTPSILDVAVSSVNNNATDPSTGQKVPTDSNWYDTDILREAVVALNLADDVTGLRGATVFAPNDRAFQVLVADLTNRPLFTLNEAAVLQTLVAIATDPATLNGTPFTGFQALEQTVLYHVSPESIPNLRSRSLQSPDITTLTALPTLVPSLTDGRIDPAFVPFVRWVRMHDDDRTDADPIYYGRTIPASNGTVHIISGVLRPLDLKVLFPGD